MKRLTLDTDTVGKTFVLGASFAMTERYVNLVLDLGPRYFSIQYKRKELS